jgi:hypothetical protein
VFTTVCNFLRAAYVTSPLLPMRYMRVSFLYRGFSDPFFNSSRNPSGPMVNSLHRLAGLVSQIGLFLEVSSGSGSSDDQFAPDREEL